MSLFQQRLSEIENIFQEENIHLGFRMLVDSVLDSEDMRMFELCIALADFQEKEPEAKENFKKKCLDLIAELRNLSVKESELGNLLIKLNDVEKKYGINKFSLGPISAEIRSGQMIGLVGENGNGKTTLLRIIANELSFDKGNCSFEFEKDTHNNYDLRTKLVYIPQRTPKWFGAVKDNLKLTATSYGIAPENNEKWVLVLMIRFGLWPFRNHKWSELSSGYKMRFELARTFLRRPKLLLLDEPLANLDILSQQLIIEDLRLLGKSITRPLGIMLSSQQLYEVEKASDEVIFLRNGKSESFNSLKANAGNSSLVIEVEVDCNRDKLLDALQNLATSKMETLGTTYYIEFKNASSEEFLSALIAHKITIKYYRDISQSTRRFFQK